MDSSTTPATENTEPILDCTPFFRVYNDGHADRMSAEDFVHPNQQHSTVSSKDISIDSEIGLSARLFIPSHFLSATSATATTKLPILIYFHGGAFIIGSPFCETYHRHVSTLVEKSNVVAVSVRYRRGPENPISAAYEDSWHAILWAASHKDGSGPDPWLNLYADFNQLFLAGDSAGANISHNMAMAAGCGKEKSSLGCGILGVALIHPFFWGASPIGSEGNNPSKAVIGKIWPVLCPDGLGNDDPRLNPLSAEAQSLDRLGCKRVLVCVAEKDALKDRGQAYYEALRKSGWKGAVEFHQTQDEHHCFHLDNFESEKAKQLVDLLTHFFNRGLPPSPII